MNKHKDRLPGVEKRKSLSKLWLIVFVLGVIIPVSWSLNRNSGTSKRENKLICVPAKWETIEQGVNVPSVIIRDEMVYISPAGGTLKLIASEKDRVRTDTLVAQIAPGDTKGRIPGNVQIDLVAERPGVVSFILDGLERTLTPSSWVDYSAKKVSQLVSKPVNTTSGMHIDTGQALFRIIDNYRIYVLAFTEPGISPTISESLVEGRRYNLRFDSIDNRTCSAKVVARENLTQDDSSTSALLLELSDFPHELYYLRHTRTTIITNTQRGLVIPKHALVKVKDGYLVYTPTNLGVESKAVRVIASDDSQVICEGLKEGQRVVVNPHVVSEAGITIWK